MTDYRGKSWVAVLAACVDQFYVSLGTPSEHMSNLGIGVMHLNLSNACIHGLCIGTVKLVICAHLKDSKLYAIWQANHAREAKG